MPRVAPLSRADHPEFEDLYQGAEASLGFVPNSILTMARRPEIARAFAGLGRAVMGGGTLPSGLKSLVALMASNAAGCRYCQAHGASRADRSGEDAAKLAALWEYETSELFSDAERAALHLARNAALVPNQASDEDFAELRRHFDDREIVEIVATIALYGFLNRWNDTLATELEDEPLTVATRTLAESGWEAGKHAS